MSLKKVDHIGVLGYPIGIPDGVLTIWIGCVERAQSLLTKLVDTPGSIDGFAYCLMLMLNTATQADFG